MSWPYAYTPDIWPMLASAAFVSALGLYAWRHRSTPGAVPLALLMASRAIFPLARAAETASLDFPTKLFWFLLADSFSLVSTVLALFFALEYSGLGKWVTRRNVALLLVPAVINFGLEITPEYRYLIYSRLSYDGSLRADLAPIGAAITIYGLALAVLTPLILIALFVRSPLHRWPVGLILLGMIVTRVVYTLAVGQSGSPAFSNWTFLAADFSAAMYALALFRFRLFNVVPIARETAIERMANGVLILDAENRVVDLNPAACHVLALTRRETIGRPACQAIAHYPDVVRLVEQETPCSAEVGLEGVSGQGYFLVQISPLTHARGFKLGRLMLLQDVTEQKRAQEQLQEQQRMLAVVQEREQLARELHDTLGQVFAFINVQGQTARRLMARGEVSTADNYVARMVEAAREADTDIRESILNLRVSLSEQGFFPALADYLQKYESNYSILTQLERPESLGESALEPAVEVQLLRILQEALSNVRKHANARSVRVGFTIDEGCIQTVVQDDGQGFSPEELHGRRSGQMFGLRFMRERAEAVGGTVAVHSQPGCGTQVVVRVPLRR